MTDSQIILDYIKDVRLKRLLLHAFYALSKSTLIILAVFLLSSLLKKVIYVKLPYEPYAFIAIYLFSFLIIFLLQFRQIADKLKNALYIDNKFALKDRFSSYIDCSRKGVSQEILTFQGKALVSGIIPKLQGRNVIEFKSHYSFKYILLLVLFVMLMTYAKDKKRNVTLLTKEEIKMLNDREEDIEKFIAYLKSKDISGLFSEKKIKEFSDIYKDSAKKIKETGLDRREAIKLLSKLIDSSKEILKDKKEDYSASQRVAKFDMDKLKGDDEFNDFMASKQTELKDKLDDLKDDETESKEKEKDFEDAKQALDEISEALDEMMMSHISEMRMMKAKQPRVSKEEAEKLKEEIEKAKEELEGIQDYFDLDKEVKEMTEKIEKTKDSFSGPQEKGEGLEYEEQEIEIEVTFDSRIDKLKKGKSGTGMGPGTTNEDVGYATFDTFAPQKGKDVHDMTKEKFTQIYAPSRIETGKDIMVVKGKMSEGESITVSTSKTLPKKTAINTPYDEVYGEYREVANKAINVQKVPKVYKDYVLDYFDSINPDLRQ